MITSDQSIVAYTAGQAIPDRLTRITHRHYLHYAERMLAVYRAGVGSTRRELHRSIGNILADEPDCDRRRIAAFCKLLDDAGEFDTDRRGESAALRLKVFSSAAARHPLVTQPDDMFESGEADVKRAIAGETGKSWEQIDAALYADVMDRQPLRAFEGYASPEALLSQYNLAQLQACLYKAHEMTVHASTDFAAIVRYAKLARLLVHARRLAADRYRIDLSGPASILVETRRYGVNFARFVAALVACRAWELSATVTTRWGSRAKVRVTSADGYRTHVAAPQPFDSEVEEKLAKQWGECRDGWRLHREAGILQQGQTTFVPDFRFVHDDGREAMLEIVGFWTPEYLQAKRKTIATFSHHRILLAVARRISREKISWPGLVQYKTRIDPDEVVAALNAVHSRVARDDSPAIGAL